MSFAIPMKNPRGKFFFKRWQFNNTLAFFHSADWGMWNSAQNDTRMWESKNIPVLICDTNTSMGKGENWFSLKCFVLEFVSCSAMAKSATRNLHWLATVQIKFPYFQEMCCPWNCLLKRQPCSVSERYYCCAYLMKWSGNDLNQPDLFIYSCRPNLQRRAPPSSQTGISCQFKWRWNYGTRTDF